MWLVKGHLKQKPIALYPVKRLLNSPANIRVLKLMSIAKSNSLNIYGHHLIVPRQVHNQMHSNSLWAQKIINKINSIATPAKTDGMGWNELSPVAALWINSLDNRLTRESSRTLRRTCSRDQRLFREVISDGDFSRVTSLFMSARWVIRMRSYSTSKSLCYDVTTRCRCEIQQECFSFVTIT